MRLFWPLLFSAGLLLYGITGVSAAEPKRILILGDSISAGYGVDPEEAYPALLQRKIDRAGLAWKVVNAGVSGDTTAGGLRRISWLLRQPVDILLLELGGNDGLRGISPEETRRNLDGIIEKVKEKRPEAKIVIAGMQMPASMGAEFARKFQEAFNDAAHESGSILIPFLLEGVAAQPSLNQPDRIHPTAAGHKIVAENVWKILEPLLRAEGGQKTG
jgi:acyl-CoA thioesterase-1